MQRRWVRRFSLVALGCLVLVGATSASAATDFVQNSSFEPPPLHGHHASRTFAVGQHMGPWLVTLGSVFLTKARLTAVVTNPHGGQVLNLAPAGDPGLAEVCQTIYGLTPGERYKLRFIATSIFGAGTIDVTFGGADISHLDLADGGLPATLHRYAWTVTANATNAGLCLDGDAAGADGFPIVDGVRVLPLAD